MIGVKDNGHIVGQEVTDNTKREIAREINKIEPTASVKTHHIPVQENKFVIAIQVEAGEHVPYIYNHRPYKRDLSSTTKMSQHHYEQLLVKRSQLNHSWETFLIDQDINSLDHEEIRKVIRDGIEANRVPTEALNEPIENLLHRLDLMRDGRITNAAQ